MNAAFAHCENENELVLVSKFIGFKTRELKMKKSQLSALLSALG